MSDTGEKNPALGGQENPIDNAGAGVWEAGVEDAGIRDSGPRGNEEAEAGAEAGVAGVAGAAGGLNEEAMEVGVPEGDVSREDSNMGPADEGQQHLDVAVGAIQHPMADFHLMFLDLVYTMLHRLYYNNHAIVPPRHHLRIIQSRPRMPRRRGRIHMLSAPRERPQPIIPRVPGMEGLVLVPWGSRVGTPVILSQGSRVGATALVPHGSGEGAGEGAAALVPRGSEEGAGEGAAALVPQGSGEGAGEGAAAMMCGGSGEGAAATAPGDQPKADVEEPMQKAEGPEETTKYQYENTEEEAQDAKTKEEKEEFNKNKKDLRKM